MTNGNSSLKSSVPTQTLEGVQIASQNEAAKQQIALEAEKLRLQGIAIDNEQKMGKYTADLQAASNQAALEQDTAKWNRKNAHDAYLAKQQQLAAQQEAHNNRRWDAIRMKQKGQAYNQLQSNNATADHIINSNRFDPSDPNAPQMLKKILALRQETNENMARLTVNQTLHEGLIGTNKEALQDALLNMHVGLNERTTSRQYLTNRNVNHMQNTIDTFLGESPNYLRILGSIDLEGSQYGSLTKGRMGEWWQQTLASTDANLRGLVGGKIAGIGLNLLPSLSTLFHSDIMSPGGVDPSEMEGYDLMYGRGGFFAGTKNTDALKGRGGIDKVVNFIEGTKQGFRDEGLEEIAKHGVQLSPVDEKSDLVSYEETLLNTQGVSREEYYEALALKHRQDMGEEIDEPGKYINAAKVYKITTLADEAGENPLWTDNWYEPSTRLWPGDWARKKDVLLSFSPDPFGDEGQLSMKGNEGEVSSLRLIQQLAPEMNKLTPGIGDDFTTTAYLLNQYTNGPQKPQDLDSLREKLEPLLLKNGGMNALILDGMWKTFSTEFDYASRAVQGEEGEETLSERALRDVLGLKKGTTHAKMLKELSRAERNQTTQLTAWGASWQAALSNGIGGSPALPGALKKEVISNMINTLPTRSVGTNSDGTTIEVPEIPDDFVDKIVSVYTQGIYGKFSKPVQEKLVATLIQDIDTEIMEKYIEVINESSGQLEEIGAERLERSFDAAEELDAFEVESLESQQAYQKTLEAEMDALLEEMAPNPDLL